MDQFKINYKKFSDNRAIAIVDCNSFYCSCERVFRPDLKKRPVVVLSNNDGCIISRSDEAKMLGVQMATPYFMAKEPIEKYNVATFSSNYNLYGDMSGRVMDTLKMLAGEENVEVYSVDECFLHIPMSDNFFLNQYALSIRHIVEQWTGVSVSVGIAATKTLAKIANHLAKENKVATKCVYTLIDQEKIEQVLKETGVSDIWGVGRAYAEKLKKSKITTALQLVNMPQDWVYKNLGGIVGVRLLKELKGIQCIELKKELKAKKMIATTRMFGRNVSKLSDIKEALSTYASRAAEKLRRQNCATSVIEIFIVAKDQNHSVSFSHGTTFSANYTLPRATSATNDLVAAAMKLAENIFKPDRKYKKAGVILRGIVPDSSIQGNMFIPQEENKKRVLMKTLDNLNFSMRNDIIKFASSGTTNDWKMRREFHSPKYTSRWSELRKVN